MLPCLLSQHNPLFKAAALSLMRADDADAATSADIAPTQSINPKLKPRAASPEGIGGARASAGE